MEKEIKAKLYEQALLELESILQDEVEIILKMSTINSLLKSKFPYFYWIGFYIVDNLKKDKKRLIIGPYQGTFGCLTIDFERGICGRCAREKKTQIVDDVHSDNQHIACDEKSKSEIVVPVFDNTQNLIAVLDIDSDELNSFDEIDKLYLEKIINRHFSQNNITQNQIL